MVGDVNIFLNARHEYDDEDEEQARKDSSSQPADIYDAECEIMIAGKCAVPGSLDASELESR
jgi:hypothetical protein